MERQRAGTPKSGSVRSACTVFGVVSWSDSDDHVPTRSFGQRPSGRPDVTSPTSGFRTSSSTDRLTSPRRSTASGEAGAARPRPARADRAPPDRRRPPHSARSPRSFPPSTPRNSWRRRRLSGSADRLRLRSAAPWTSSSTTAQKTGVSPPPALVPPAVPRPWRFRTASPHARTPRYGETGPCRHARRRSGSRTDLRRTRHPGTCRRCSDGPRRRQLPRSAERRTANKLVRKQLDRGSRR